VDNMCQQMDWTRQLGEAFKADQESVMDAVQRKRTAAEQIGNLQSSPQMKVENKKADNGQAYVAIAPADPKVVYVPQYNPVTIYNNPAPAAPAPAAPAQGTTATTTEKESGVSGGEAAAIGLLSFGVGMALGAAINNNDDYYPYPAWGHGSVYVARGPYYPAAYRPPVYAGYRPAYGYHPPSNYRWNQYNRNVNTTINNNYYNRFNTTNVNRQQAYQNRTANTRPVQNQSNWKGQSTYQGARSTGTPAQRPGGSMANVNPRNQQYENRNQVATNRANAERTDAAANRANTQRMNTADRANAERAATANRANAERANTSSVAENRAPQNFDRGGDRGYSAPERPTRSAEPAASSSGSSSASGRTQSASSAGGAFGGGGSGREARAESSRGRSSMGASGGGGRRR
jgi:hypothetical protein